MSTESAEELAHRTRSGDRAAIAAALNLLDDTRPASVQQAQLLLDELTSAGPRDGAHLIGLTGPPGVGKSTLTAALIRHWRGEGRRVGILAVDPSSPITGGALLGDRLRMNTGVEDEAVFIRSLSSRGQFGGLSTEVWPMSLVMLACFDIVLVETVGVGQREVDVASSCDTTCFVAQPGSGDSIQFLKAGVLEVPHILVVNKSDMGDVASRTLSELRGTLASEHPDGAWQVPAIATSAVTNEGVAELGATIARHRQHLLAQGALPGRRHRYQAHWLLKRVEEEYGRAGVASLGGASALTDEFGRAPGNPIRQFEACRQRLAN